MRQRIRTLLKHIALFGGYGLLCIVLTLVVVLLVHLESRTDLEPWHVADLDEEFSQDSGIETFDQYLALEDRLFGQLQRLVYDRTGGVGEDFTNRYKRGSLSDPGRWQKNWNRSFELTASKPRAAVLLLHGLSDSPYSMRSIGQDLNRSGAAVIGLRVPGHGTAPSGLVTTRWPDMAAAVRLAMNELGQRYPGLPLHIVGYSNGAALAVNYALAAIEDPQLPRADRLVLISPEIGVTALAAFAVWQGRLGHLLGLHKVAWNEILPEYDPFKYGSFAVNAGDVSYRITAEIQRQITELDEKHMLSGMPPILAFSSVVDATVRAPDLVRHLFDRIEPNDHELVLYDVNRVAGLRQLYRTAPDEMFETILQKRAASFSLSLVTNEHPDSPGVVVRTWPLGLASFTEQALDEFWPPEMFSLSHVALPFREDDPLYGSNPDDANPDDINPGIMLGNLALRGERGTLQVSSDAMLRQRWNPFWDYQQQRIRAFLSLQ